MKLSAWNDMLNATLKTTKNAISNEAVHDTTIPLYIHRSDEMHNWTPGRSKYYYDNIAEDIARPTSERYWKYILGTRASDHFLHKSYVCKVKQLKDKNLAGDKV